MGDTKREEREEIVEIKKSEEVESGVVDTRRGEREKM